MSTHTHTCTHAHTHENSNYFRKKGDGEVVVQQEGKGEQPGLAQGSALFEFPFSISLSPQNILSSKSDFI